MKLCAACQRPLTQFVGYLGCTNPACACFAQHGPALVDIAALDKLFDEIDANLELLAVGSGDPRGRIASFQAHIKQQYTGATRGVRALAQPQTPEEKKTA